MSRKKPQQPSFIRAGLIEITPGALCNDIKWVLRAKCKEDSRYVLKLLCVEADDMVCTDGKRLHALHSPGHGVEPGLYHVVSIGKSAILRKDESGDHYPAWRQVVPETDVRSGVSVYDKHVAVFEINKAGLCIDLDYATDAIAGTEMKVFTKTPDAPAMLKSERYTAVIMTKRVQ